jgi:CRISPR-associated protein Csb1
MRLEPAGGPDDKVFPPTYLGGVYAIEKRRIKNANGEGEIVTCVVLDSVQSQANRLEESLLRAYEAKKLRFPLMVVDFSKQEAGSTQTDPEISSVGRITALDAPHRIADAIFRDSVLRANNQTRPFRQSEEGRSFENANIRNATALFELCPTALVFGTWDSTGSRGGLGNKFARTLVSEIIGVRAAVGVRTNSRIDPLGIEKCDLYEDLNGDWTVDLSKAKRNDKGEPIKYGPKGKDKGKPSAINHGNVPPDFPRYSADDAENSTPDALKSSRVELRYDVSGEDGRLSSRSFVQSNEIPIRAGEIKPGGVTIAHALQTSVLSIPGLRRLRFPDGNGKTSAERDNAARTVLAALALAAIAHQREAGWDLRSRCLLIPVDETTPVEIVHSSSSRMPYSMSAADSVALVEEAVRVARENGFKWSDKEIVLWPSNKLVELVQEGRKVAAHVAEGE